MKLIGLVSFRNEESALPAHIASVLPYVDELIGLDHDSTDQSARVFEDNVGSRPIQSPSWVRPWSNGGELDVRCLLLEQGRRRGGTHFLVLDADECLTPPAGRVLRSSLETTPVGEALLMPWVICWKSTRRYRVGATQWNMPMLDFAFHDSPSLSYEARGVLHVSRTPVPPEAKRLHIDPSLGGVIHYQFAFWEQTQIKKAWYRCIDWINRENSAQGINRMYQASKDDEGGETADLPQDWLPPVDPSVFSNQWRLEQIYSWFDEYGIEFFEPLDIWDVETLRAEFQGRVGRLPEIRSGSDFWFRVRRKIMRSGRRLLAPN